MKTNEFSLIEERVLLVEVLRVHCGAIGVTATNCSFIDSTRDGGAIVEISNIG